MSAVFTQILRNQTKEDKISPAVLTLVSNTCDLTCPLTVHVVALLALKQINIQPMYVGRPVPTSGLFPNLLSGHSLSLRERSRSLWMIYSPPSSAPVVPCPWLLNTSSTCWTSRRCSTASQTQRPSTSGRPTGNQTAAAREAEMNHVQHVREATNRC